MRLREWFSWHFPELAKIVTDGHIYAKCVNLIEKRENISDEMKDDLVEILHDDEKAQ